VTCCGTAPAIIVTTAGKMTDAPFFIRVKETGLLTVYENAGAVTVSENDLL
jgi:hypothetical protein